MHLKKLRAKPTHTTQRDAHNYMECGDNNNTNKRGIGLGQGNKKKTRGAAENATTTLRGKGSTQNEMKLI